MSSLLEKTSFALFSNFGQGKLLLPTLALFCSSWGFGQTVSISNTTNGSENNTGNVTNGVFTVSLSAASGTDTVISYGVAGTATSGSDFTPLSGTVTILASETTATILVAVIEDQIVETGGETVQVTLTGVTIGAAVLDAVAANLTATNTIADDDTCRAGDEAPILDTSQPTEFCDVLSTDLDNYVTDSAPAGSVLTWSTNSDPLVVIAHRPGLVAAPGSYFGFFFNAANHCASPVLTISLIRMSDCVFDNDGDGLTNGEENDLGTNPTLVDTDGDGLTDGEEVLVVDDPNTAAVPENPTDALDACDPFLTPSCNPDPIDLAVSKAVDNDTPPVQSDIVFTITLSNATMDRVLDIEVNDLLDSSFAYVSHTTSKGVYDETTGVWSIDGLTSQEIVTLEITATVLVAGQLQNTATIVSSFPPDAREVNNVAIVALQVNASPCIDPGTLCNIFSPNGDGINDTLVFIDPNGDFPNTGLEVFDRYGNSVFEMDQYDSSWNGTGSNGDLPKGTYFYLLDLRGDGTEVVRGWIQIIR